MSCSIRAAERRNKNRWSEKKSKNRRILLESESAASIRRGMRRQAVPITREYKARKLQPGNSQFLHSSLDLIDQRSLLKLLHRQSSYPLTCYQISFDDS